MAELSSLEKIRLEKIEELRAEGIEPYPTRAVRTHTSAEAIAAFEQAEKAAGEGKTPDEVKATLAGRIRATRAMGKVSFAHIEDGAGKIQLFLRINELGQERVDFFNKMFDIGDFIQASGVMMRTRTGEVTLHVHDFTLLAKSVSPLPAAKDETLEDGTVVRHAALEDPELRARQRYADLAVNPDVRETFRKRARIVSSLRRFLDEHGFLEVETPILQPIYGGAAARPFTTHHNELKQDLYLRISFELYLKRLLVGNLERVYEIGRDFRNEGVSFKHNPEFTQLEFYWAYADYLQVMELTEQMVSTACKDVTGSSKVIYQGHELDFTPPWKRLEMRQGLLDVTGIDIAEHRDADSLAAALRKKGFNTPVNATRGKLIDFMLSEYPRTDADPADLPLRLSARYFAAGEIQARRPADRGALRRLRGWLRVVQCLHRVERSARPGTALHRNGTRLRRRRRRETSHGRGLPARHALWHASQRRIRHGRGPADHAADRQALHPRGAAVPAPAQRRGIRILGSFHTDVNDGRLLARFPDRVYCTGLFSACSSVRCSW